jgi:D-arabinose 5-phosphate isomerase GutQ
LRRAILARAAALILDFPFGAAGDELEEEPKMEVSSFSNALILSLMSAARFSCDDVSVSRLLMVDLV